jgi:Na+/H+ antiporter NhaD/arsenite permease-like protein
LNFHADIIVLFPFTVRIPIPRRLSDAVQNFLIDLEITSPWPDRSEPCETAAHNSKALSFEFNFVTAPLIADLILLAILAIGRKEVHDGTLGANSILPYNIMIFFLTLAYIAISIDCSGLIRHLAWKVLEKGGRKGKRLYFLLYIFFFALGSFIGNDPIILSGTSFLAYMTKLSPNIVTPRAWIHTQFAVANIASAILVSSNPTNLVLAGAFGIKFVTYTVNMVVPVFFTIIVLFPFLLWVIFHDENLIPSKIDEDFLTRARAQRDRAQRDKKHVDPNIPDSRELAEEQGDQELLDALNPFINWKSAAFGACAMSATLITLLIVNASDQKKGGTEVSVCYITLPAAFVMFCWDLGSGWLNRKETREIAKDGREAKEARVKREQERVGSSISVLSSNNGHPQNEQQVTSTISTRNEAQELVRPDTSQVQQMMSTASGKEDEEKGAVSPQITVESMLQSNQKKSMIVRFASRVLLAHRWSRETFPTVTTVLSHLPYKLLPFAFSMFVLVQALVSKGWVAVFAYGWDYVCRFMSPLSLCSVSFKLSDIE